MPRPFEQGQAGHFFMIALLAFRAKKLPYKAINASVSGKILGEEASVCAFSYLLLW